MSRNASRRGVRVSGCDDVLALGSTRHGVIACGSVSSGNSVIASSSSIGANGDSASNRGGGSLAITELKEEELKDLNDDGDANADTATEDFARTGSLGDFASLSNWSVANGNSLDLESPDNVGCGRGRSRGSD